MTEKIHHNEEFDFLKHKESAIADYLNVHSFYVDLSEVANKVIIETLKQNNIQVHSIEYRAKEPISFGKKASKPSSENPHKPKYQSPLKEITDLSAVRIITFFPRVIEEIDSVLSKEFNIIERLDKEKDLIEEEKFGYKSIHYLAKLTHTRTSLPEYERFKDHIIEIQVRTILQHAWAEIEHDIQYKSSDIIPTDIKRRFIALAGLLEIADREFQAIQDADKDLMDRSIALIEAGELNKVEITPKAIKTYLDMKLGTDGRMSDFSYQWMAKLLKKLGFKNLEQVDNCISPFDGDELSRIIIYTRQGQTTRFEYMLLAGMGQTYIEHHLYSNEEWFKHYEGDNLAKIKSAGISTGTYGSSFSESK